VTANRCGADTRPHGEIAFTGQSQIVAPRGELVYRAPSDQAQLHVAEIDIERARDNRFTAQNHILADRRPAYYTSLCSPWRSSAGRPQIIPHARIHRRPGSQRPGVLPPIT
jgi:predicted amidohydrolase